MECKVNSISLHYEEFGAGKPVLCLHGFPQDSRTMIGCIEPVLKDSGGFRRIYPDLPGMGKSGAGDWIKNADVMLEIVKEFIRQVIKDESFLLVGLSYGGYLSLGLMFQNDLKIERVFLICPCVKSEHKRRNTEAKDQLFIREAFFEEHENDPEFKDFLESAVIADEETWLRYQKEILAGSKSVDKDFTEKYERDGYGFSFESELRRIEFNKPLYVITGRQDNCVGYKDCKALLAHLPQTVFRCLDHAGHNLQLDQKDAFNQFFSEWLEPNRM